MGRPSRSPLLDLSWATDGVPRRTSSRESSPGSAADADDDPHSPAHDYVSFETGSASDSPPWRWRRAPSLWRRCDPAAGAPPPRHHFCVTCVLTALVVGALLLAAPPANASLASGGGGVTTAFHLPSACDPKPGGADCNPPAPCPSAWMRNASAAASCIRSQPALASFCHYAGMREAGLPAEVRPKCELTGERARLPADATPLQGNARVVVFGDGNASAPTTVNCFASLKEPSDRLCITTAFYASIDCVPDGERPTVLRALLAVGDADFRGRNGGRAPQFQCFHRGGYGSVPWLHLHSFDGHADSICPLMRTALGAPPNPLPRKIACSDGGAQTVEARALQIESLMEAAPYTPPYAYGDGDRRGD